MNVRAVITGMGAISPAGLGVSALWKMVRDGIPVGGRKLPPKSPILIR
jgi:hypothetical protein